jgi:hypothetical protein
MNTAKLFIIFFLSILSINGSASYINAEESILYQNNFEQYDLNTTPTDWNQTRNYQWSSRSNVCKNGSTNAEWIINNFNSNKVIGITLNGPPCIFEITPDNFSIPDTSNYIFEIDIIIPSTSGSTRNIAFLYNSPSEFYDLKLLPPNTVEMQKVVFQEFNQHFTNFAYNPGFDVNQRYRFKITTINNHISVFINDQLQVDFDNIEPQIDTASFALQASSSTSDSNTVYFDNIVVSEIIDPTPTPTPNPTPEPTPSFPHFSQLDPEWKDLEYDHAITNNPDGYHTMGQLSCAVSSAAMLVAKQGYPVGPDGQPTNPWTLNQYLTNNNHYTNNSGVVWSGVTKYAQQTKDNNQVSSSTPSLEFSYQNYDKLALINKLNQNLPALLRIGSTESGSGTHFVALSDYNSNDDVFTLHDPLDLTFNNQILSTEYPLEDSYQKVGIFTPSFTDLSYIWLYLHKPSISGYIEYMGQKTGVDTSGKEVTQIPNSFTTLEYPTFSPLLDTSTLSNQSLTPSRLIAIPKPSTGKYLIYIESADPILPSDVELFTYDQVASHSAFTPITSSNSSNSYLLTLEQDSTDHQNTNIYTASSQQSLWHLKELIIELEKQNHIKNSKYSKRLIKYIDQAERHANKPRVSYLILSNSFSKLNDIYYKRGLLDQTAHQQISSLLQAVLANLK